MQLVRGADPHAFATFLRVFVQAEEMQWDGLVELRDGTWTDLIVVDARTARHAAVLLDLAFRPDRPINASQVGAGVYLRNLRRGKVNRCGLATGCVSAGSGLSMRSGPSMLSRCEQEYMLSQQATSGSILEIHSRFPQ